MAAIMHTIAQAPKLPTRTHRIFPWMSHSTPKHVYCPGAHTAEELHTHICAQKEDALTNLPLQPGVKEYSAG